MPRQKKVKPQTIKRVRLETFIRRLDGRLFTVEFIKQDKTKRQMTARTGVKKGVKGTGHPNGVATSCIKVFDMGKNEYRQINLETVLTISADGIKYKVI
jgi:hypothetical protein